MVRVEGGLNMRRTRVQRFVGVDAMNAEELAELLTEK